MIWVVADEGGSNNNTIANDRLVKILCLLDLSNAIMIISKHCKIHSQ